MQSLSPELRLTPELDLLLHCARTGAWESTDAITRILADGVDWAAFAQKAVDHGLVGLVGQTLARTAADLVPADILDAFGAVLAEARSVNTALFNELVRLRDSLEKAGVPMLPFKGPVLALTTYGDIGLRTFRDLDFLVRDDDLRTAIAALRRLGYERQEGLTDKQLDLTHWIQGQEVMFRQGFGTCIEPHTRLTSIRMALNIDHEGLWKRARLAAVSGRTMLVLAPEDEFLVLAIHGGKELWWNIKWACDAAAFIRAHPELDWDIVVERAGAQGCRRMTLLATALARTFFEAEIPEDVVRMEQSNAALHPMMERILATWQEHGETRQTSAKTVSMDRLRLHDGVVRKAGYVARTCFLPGPHHVPLLSVGREFRFLYVPVKLAHDGIALPIWRLYQRLLVQHDRAPKRLSVPPSPVASEPASSAEGLARERHQIAEVEAKRALAANPRNAAAWRNLAKALAGLGRHEEAIACYDNALRLAPDNMNFWAGRRAAVVAMGGKSDFTNVDEPQDATDWTVRAGRMMFSQSLAEAVEATDRALALDPDNVVALRMGIQSRLHSCDWRRREEDKAKIGEGVHKNVPMISPLFHRAISDSEEEHRILTENWGKGLSAATQKLWRGEQYRHEKIRLAYISTDFRDHVVADAIIGCLENHDRNRFELTIVSLGPNDHSEMRRRIESTVDRFFDAQFVQDADVAIAMRQWEIDIAVDLNGISGDRRSGILARRPAPLQVNYLGYPGTMGLPFMDYIIADRTIIPDENTSAYVEQVIYLPHTYLANDPKRVVGILPSRAEAGLPPIGFVFACLNQNYKIAPEIFGVWMRLLLSVDGSVLWLQGNNKAVIANLRREAHARGVAPDRLIFKSRQPQSKDYLARLALADLFLDTLPYNAHATASDCLCIGVPLVTCIGRAFPGRVAASVLQAAGLPELVTHSLKEYEDLARELANNPERLLAVRARLAEDRRAGPLFETKRFTLHLEQAYITMWERQQNGEPPAHFAVQA